MDRQIVYPGQILPETSLLQMAKDSMIGVAKLSAAMFGTSTVANGFAVVPTGPASLQVVCSPGEIYNLTSIDALAFSTLPADTTHSIVKQGILLDGVTLSCPAPGTAGQSINYLIQATYQDTDSNPVLLPYYNSANPALPYSGMGNNGLTQNTARKGSAVVAVKAGASAVTGSQVTPAPDAGYVGLYVVTVAFGQTTITGGSISQYSGAPLLPAGLLQSLQSGKTTSAIDIGTANAYAANFTPAITSLTDGLTLCIKASNANTTASTFTPAPGVISPSQIVGAAHSALQGGEIAATGDLWLQWNTSVGGGSWIILDSTGGGLQIAAATKSSHAINLGQAVGRLLNVQIFRTPGTFTYTKTTGTTATLVEASGAGASGAGTPATGAGQCAVGGPGGSGAYASAWFPSGIASGTSVVVGTGGAPVNGGGNNGGVTSVGAIISCPGGRFGSTAGPSAPPLVTGGGAGATGTASVTSGTAINTTAGRSGGLTFAIGLTATSIGGAPGADGQWGGGGSSVAGNVPGNSAAAPGAGGSGAVTNASQATISGGAGGNGIVIFYEFGSA